MRASVTKSFAVSLAALALSLAIVAAATQFFARALGVGLLGGIVVASHGDGSCVQYRSTYDRWGNHIGRRAVDVCE